MKLYNYGSMLVDEQLPIPLEDTFTYNVISTCIKNKNIMFLSICGSIYYKGTIVHTFYPNPACNNYHVDNCSSKTFVLNVSCDHKEGNLMFLLNGFYYLSDFSIYVEYEISRDPIKKLSDFDELMKVEEEWKLKLQSM